MLNILDNTGGKASDLEEKHDVGRYVVFSALKFSLVRKSVVTTIQVNECVEICVKITELYLSNIRNLFSRACCLHIQDMQRPRCQKQYHQKRFPHPVHVCKVSEARNSNFQPFPLLMHGI